jgi:hypothetical protein
MTARRLFETRSTEDFLHAFPSTPPKSAEASRLTCGDLLMLYLGTSKGRSTGAFSEAGDKELWMARPPDGAGRKRKCLMTTLSLTDKPPSQIWVHSIPSKDLGKADARG